MHRDDVPSHLRRFFRPARVFKPKDLIDTPHMLAEALREDGWYLRSDIVWAKNSPMPSSVRDRPTAAHEQLFLLTPRSTYFYDQDAERVAQSEASLGRYAYPFGGSKAELLTAEAANGPGTRTHPIGDREPDAQGRNLWTHWQDIAQTPEETLSILLRHLEEEGLLDGVLSTLWPDISSEPLKEKHYAAYPSALAERCIRLGTSAKGQCPACGAPWRRVVERRRKATRPGVDSKVYEPDPEKKQDVCGNPTLVGFNQRWKESQVVGNRDPLRHCTEVSSRGWEPTCTCNAGAPVPQLVLDPFCGSGSTGVAARAIGRRFVGVELNPEYAALSRRRIGAVCPLADACDRSPHARAFADPPPRGLFDALETP